MDDLQHKKYINYEITCAESADGRLAAVGRHGVIKILNAYNEVKIFFDDGCYEIWYNVISLRFKPTTTEKEK